MQKLESPLNDTSDRDFLMILLLQAQGRYTAYNYPEK